MKLIKLYLSRIIKYICQYGFKYLIENEKYDIARVQLRSGKVAHVLINYISDDIFEFDLSNNNIRFHEIDKVIFIKIN